MKALHSVRGLHAELIQQRTNLIVEGEENVTDIVYYFFLWENIEKL